MRYVGGDYDQFDDDDDEELEDDEDESLDDDEESGSASRSRVNPFGGSSTSSFGSNRPTSSLPGGGARTSAPPSSSASGSRLPGTPGPSSPSNRPATPGTSSGGGSSTSPFGVNRPPGGSSSAPGSGGSGGSSNFGGNRPASSGSSFGGSGSGGSGSGSGGSGAGGSGFNRPGSSSSPSSSSGGSSSGGSGSSFGGNRPGGGSSSPSSGSGGSSPSGARPGSSNPFSGGASSSAAKPAGKDDDKKSGGGVLGGLTSRFGGGKSDDKPATPKSSGGDKAGGGMLGGITSRFGGGKSDDKPATPKSSGGDKGSGGGLLGGITSRFGGGKTDDKKPAGPSGSSSSPYGARPGSSTSTSSSSGLGGGAKPGASSGGDAGKSGGLFSKSPFGKLGGNNPTGTTAKPSTPAKSGEQRSGLGRLFPFLGGGSASKPADKKPRQSKAPHVEGGGLTLDNKLDILGVALVLSSLALIFSRLSTTRGALTESINNLFIQLTGWGSIAIPAAMLAVGIWLIARHFGEEAPVIPRNRIIGIVITYLGLLLLLQYIDSFSYLNRDGSPTDVASLRNVWLPIAINRGTGGGQIGAELYYFLVSNVTEIGAFFVLLFMLILGLMFTLDIGAAEMAMIVVGNVRNLQEGMQRRRERRAQAAAASLEQLTASATAPPISVTKEAVPALPPAPTPALPAASEPALPAGEPVRAERPIAINIGGKKENSPAGGLFNPPEKQAVEKSPAAPTPAPAGGGITARLRGALPLPGNKAPAAETTPAANANDGKVSGAAVAAGAAAGVVGGGLRGLFNRSGKGEAADDKGAKPAAVTAASAPAASSPSPTAATGSPAKTEAPPARLGDLMKPAPATAATAGGTMSSSTQSGLGSAPRSPYAPAAGTSSGGSSTGGGTTPSSPTSPFKAAPAASGSAFRATSVPSSTRPEDALDDIDDELDDELEDSEDLSTLAPAQPKGEGPLPRPQSSRFGISTFGANKPAESGTAAAGDRNDRLNAIRSGGGVSSPTPGSSDSSKAPEKPAASTEAKPVVGGTITLGKTSTGTMPAVKPPEKMDAAASSASTTSSPTGGDAKTAQPAAAFWKSPTESATAKAVIASSDTPAPEAALPKAPAPPPSSAFGKPEDPAGVSLNREGMATASSPTASAPAPASSVPIGRSPEIQRPAGVGTSAPTNVPRKRKEWRMPNISQVLMPGSENDFDRAELLRRARIIEETLQSFGAPGKVVEVNTGPVITQFGVEPDYLVTRGGKKNRVKVGAIAQLDKDLQLALGAKSIRIEAPVPGKGYVGIEVPNDAASLVSLRDVMESDQFKKLFNKSPLAIALGQSVDGTPVSADLGSMPHLLIAGTTGSGKSVCVNAIITSLIAMNPPDRVKFIMVDPKRVELTGYNGIPHLVAPVVVELERIVGVLKWVTREMDERYKKFSTAGARNIEDFNKHLGENAEVMPYIVVIIDELADLMMLAPDETERVITRIAALARATGIHLVIATQRPSVDVVTGLIKANFPARIAFAVAGGVDSRVILDQPGAERLLGKGDMLYMSGDAPAALRLQGVYVSDQEIQNITRYWKAQVTADDVPARPISALVVDNTVAEPSRAVVEGNERSQVQQAFWDRDERNTSPLSSGGANDDDIPDDQEDVLYEEAVDMVRRLNKASVSLLQRRLRIGYTRAARLIDRMEEEGIVGPAVEGAKPREVLPQK